MLKIAASPVQGVSASPISDEDILVWQATITGPDESPWEGEMADMVKYDFENLH